MSIPAPFLAELKAWLGIAPDDTSQDAFLTAQAEAVLGAMRNATGRWLYPPSTFEDAFATPVDPCNPCARGCGCACPPVATAEKPAGDLIGVWLYEAEQPVGAFLLTPQGVLIDAATRRAVAVPATGELRMRYVGGYQDLPPELKAALFDLVGSAFQASGRGQSPGTGVQPGVMKVSIVDVGSVDYASIDDSLTSTASPILGRYAVLLTPYVDLAASIGGHPCRASIRVGDAPAPGP